MLWDAMKKTSPVPGRPDTLLFGQGCSQLVTHTWPPDKAGLGQGWALWAPRGPQSTSSWSSHARWLMQWAVLGPGDSRAVCRLAGAAVHRHGTGWQRGGRGRRSSSLLYSVTSLRGRRFVQCYSPDIHTLLTGKTEVWSSQLLPECKALCCGGWSLITGRELWNDVNNVSTKLDERFVLCTQSYVFNFSLNWKRVSGFVWCVTVCKFLW